MTYLLWTIIALVLSLTALRLNGAEADAAAASDAAFVHVDGDGHLIADGVRQRYWGVIGGFPNATGIVPEDDAATRAAKLARSRGDSEALVARFTALGFNLNRIWHGFADQDYVAGDGSWPDVVDHFIACAARSGMRFWCASTNGGTARPDDVGIIDDPATAAAWRDAVAGWNGGEVGLVGCIARAWDPRLEAIGIRHQVAVATHVNHHRGVRWCDDPAFVAWELSNEEWWMSHMVGGGWRGLPAFFRDQLIARWNGFLRTRYADEAGLTAAWGFLLPGERLSDGTVQLLPMASGTTLSGMDEQARRQLAVAYGSADAAIGRDQLLQRRGEDVLAFLVDLHGAHKSREADALRPLGRSTRTAPIAWDTGIGYEIQSQWLHQQSGVSVHDAYINGWSNDPAHHRFPWYSGLEEAPMLCQDVPWLEHNKIPGMPYLCYETQIQQPAKYRAEYPLRLLALASIQDWDAVCWHYWGGVDGIGADARPFDRALDVTTGSHPQGYHYTYDEVQNAMMRACGLAFRAQALRPAPTPTTFTYGRRSLHDPASMDYAGSYGRIGWNMLPTTYRHGVRIRIDPTREDDVVDGPMVDLKANARTSQIRPTDQIAFDWQKGGLTCDAPAFAAFAGFMAAYGDRLAFASGVELSDVVVVNPPDMPYPVGDDERYIGFALVAEDGLPLATTRLASLSLVSTSFNTGFHIATDGSGQRHGGHAPVLIARVSATVRAPMLAGAAYEMLDWHMQPIASGRVGADGVVAISAAQPVFVVRFRR